MMQQLSLLLILFFSVLFHCNIHAINSISIIANEQLLQNPTTQKTIDDCIRLLQKACQCKVNANDRDSEIQLLLPDQKITIDTKKNILKDSISYLAYPSMLLHLRLLALGYMDFCKSSLVLLFIIPNKLTYQILVTGVLPKI
jgi:hypothetical protein